MICVLDVNVAVVPDEDAVFVSDGEAYSIAASLALGGVTGSVYRLRVGSTVTASRIRLMSAVESVCGKLLSRHAMP